MSFRPKHRVQALERRIERVKDGLPADPSNRDGNPKRRNLCPSCKREIRQPGQFRMHYLLNGCGVAS